MSLAEKLKSSVSERYKTRVLELARVLDPKVDYKFVSVNRIFQFKEKIAELTKAKSGNVKLFSDVLTLNGNVVMFPEIISKGELVILLIMTKEFNPQSQEAVSTHTLLFFESKPVSLNSFYLNSGGGR